MVQTVIINSYKQYLGKSTNKHVSYEPKLQSILKNQLHNSNVYSINMYNMEGTEYRHEFNFNKTDGEIKDMYIFCNVREKGSTGIYPLQTHTPTINGIEHFAPNFYNVNHELADTSPVIFSQEGNALAEWIEEKWQLNILFDLFNANIKESDACDIFKFIIVELATKILSRRNDKNSWIHSNDKKSIVANINANLISQKKSIINQERDKIAKLEEDVKNHQRSITRSLDAIYQKRRFVMNEDVETGNIVTQFIKDLDLLCAYEKIEDVSFVNDIFRISTIPLYIIDKNKRYYGGRYTIEMNLITSTVRFFGDNPRRSYWTSLDPHPHVNGNSGEACLGNIASTIAELCSQYQLYPLTLLCIDFLESVNPADSAGKYVTNWDLVDENGNIIEIQKTTCHCCGDSFNDADLIRAYEYVDDDGNWTNPRLVCQECLDDNYYWDDHNEIYLVSEDDD